MSVAIVTGSAGLIGSETARFLTHRGLEIVGIDNDMRSVFFGADASTAWNRRRLEAELRNYRHFSIDIRHADALNAVFARYGHSIVAVVHTAAQPSHDWAARDPRTDFTTNGSRRISPETSTIQATLV
jgi:CDP-paratose 2-epimerase